MREFIEEKIKRLETLIESEKDESFKWWIGVNKDILVGTLKEFDLNEQK